MSQTYSYSLHPINSGAGSEELSASNTPDEQAADNSGLDQAVVGLEGQSGTASAHHAAFKTLCGFEVGCKLGTC